MKLSGKTAIVTGSGSGIGKAIAVLFAEKGANVVVADTNQKAIDEVVGEIKDIGGNATWVLADIGRQEFIDKMIDSGISTFGSLDILVNNAGIMDDFKAAGEVDDDLIRLPGLRYSLHLRTRILSMALPLSRMAAGGQDRSGRSKT